MARRVHNSLDNLPAPLKAALTAMVVDNAWPSDFQDRKFEGNPRYEDMVEYCGQNGWSISKSAIGRWVEHLKVFELMKSCSANARDVMAGLTEENAPKTQKAAAEMATALLLKVMVSGEDFTPKQLKEVSEAIRACSQVSIKTDQYIRDQYKEKMVAAAKLAKTDLTKAGVNEAIIQKTIDKFLGVIQS